MRLTKSYQMFPRENITIRNENRQDHNILISMKKTLMRKLPLNILIPKWMKIGREFLNITLRLNGIERILKKIFWSSQKYTGIWEEFIIEEE